MKQNTHQEGKANSRSQGPASSSFKYRYMKWQRKFFDDHKMRTVFSEKQEVTMPLGVFAQYLFIRLMNESIAHEGILRYDDETPYNPEFISRTFALDQKNVELALSVLERDRLIRWDSDNNLILQYAMDSIGQKVGTTSTERVRKWRASQKEKTAGNIGNANETKRNDVSCVSRNGCNDIIKNKEEEEKDKEIESTPHNPPQGGEVVGSLPLQKVSSGDDDKCESVNPNTNGAAGFAPPRTLTGQLEYPPEKIRQGYDAAYLPQEDRESFCDFMFKSGELENRQGQARINTLPAYLKKRYNSWVADGGQHADAPAITREELAAWVTEQNPKRTMKITGAEESGFWDWLVAVGFKNGKGKCISKWNVGGTIDAWVSFSRKDGCGAKGSGQQSQTRRPRDFVHADLGVETRKISF